MVRILHRSGYQLDGLLLLRILKIGIKEPGDGLAIMEYLVLLVEEALKLAVASRDTGSSAAGADVVVAEVIRVIGPHVAELCHVRDHAVGLVQNRQDIVMPEFLVTINTWKNCTPMYSSCRWNSMAAILLITTFVRSRQSRQFSRTTP